MSKIVCYLTYVSRCGGQYRQRRTVPLGINARQANLLVEICATPGLSQDALAKRMFLNKSVVARLLADMEEQGFLKRPVCEKDRRVVRLHPTEKALEILPRLQKIEGDWERFLTSDMTAEEIATLEAVLCRLHTRAAQWTEVEE